MYWKMETKQTQKLVVLNILECSDVSKIWIKCDLKMVAYV
jgi:hypothetical protein